MPSPQANSRSPSAMDRRQFLRGVGACLALPTLASLLPSRGLAASARSAGPGLGVTASGAPLRTAFVYFPNGAIPAAWWPEVVAGGAPTFARTLAPLAALQHRVQVLGGLDHANANGGEDGGGDHARGNGVFLTGVRIKKSASDLRAGVSIDQAMAQEMGHLTRLPSLELSCEATRRAGVCDSGYACAYQFNLSWRDASTPLPPESNPRLVFERLFGAGPHGSRAEEARRRLLARKSVLDSVMDDASRLQSRADRADREKIEQYLTGVREVERRIQQAERFGPNVDPLRETPVGIPQSHGEHVRQMYDLLALAFQTDSTRIATLALAHDGDNRSFGEIGISEGHHDLSHHQNSPERIAKVERIDLWYAEHFARFLRQLEDLKDADGQSLLYNTRIVYGSGNADGNRHTHDNLPVLLAGNGGGLLNPGRYVRHGSRPMSNLFLSLADQAGLTGLQRFGDSTGRLSGV